ncbi:MAG: RNA polymerase sigma factor [bacterium]|nr:RNA polymerase sigma factor [bacterium]
MNGPLMTGFDPIYKKYSPEIYRYAFGLTLNRDEAKDIVAETFARALTAYNPDRHPTVRAFLFTIAHRLVTDYFRRRRQTLPTDLDQVAHEPQFDGDSENRDLLLQTLVFVTTLPQIEREALLLRAQGLSYEEISAALSITVNAAKVRVHRVRLKLAEWRANNN